MMIGVGIAARFLFWGFVWACSLGTFDIKVGYSDGLRIHFKSWLRKYDD